MKRVSEVDNTQFPYDAATVCWVLICQDGTVANPATADARRAAVRAVLADGARLYIAWPGQWRTDLFEVDDLDALRAAFTPSPPCAICGKRIVDEGYRCNSVWVERWRHFGNGWQRRDADHKPIPQRTVSVEG